MFLMLRIGCKYLIVLFGILDVMIVFCFMLVVLDCIDVEFVVVFECVWRVWGY